MTITLKQGDCLELMKELPDKSIDCIITDPPYGENIGKMTFTKHNGKTKSGGLAKNGNYKNHANWDAQRPAKELIDELIRVSTNQIIFGGNFLANMLPSSRCWFIWDKRGNDKYTNDFADCELIYTSFDKPSRVFRHLWNGMLQEDMSNKEERVHPTQKPLKLMHRIIEKYTKPNETICDPFIGSGTTGVACQQLGRNFIGYELDEGYFKIAQKRISEAVAQKKLYL